MLPLPIGNRAFEAAHRVLGRLRQAGHEAWLVGGGVRDLLLGQTPKEFDVATSARPHEVEALFPRTLAVGRSFGVILVVEDDKPIQVATFRRDEAYLDGRRPSGVVFSSLDEDARRRDFTINALYWDPDGDVLVDPVGGRADLEQRLLRAIGDPRARFEEDHLRMLRAVRFHCRLGFMIDPPTLHAIRDLAPRIRRVSMERIRAELEGVLLSPRPAEGIDLLDQLGLLEQFLPEIPRLKGVPQPPEFHPEGDVYTHTLACLRHMQDPDFPTALAVLLHDAGKPDTLTAADRIRFHGHDKAGAQIAAQVARRLRLSAAETEKVVWLVRHHLRLRDVPQMRQSTFRRLAAEPHFGDLVRLVRADLMGSHGDLSILDEVERRLRELRSQPLRPEPLLRGRDLIAMGLTPGPRFGEILRAIYDLQLEGRIVSRQEALQHARRLAGA